MSFTPRITATPTINVAGYVATPGGDRAAYLAVDSLSLTWGRSSLFEHPTPSTAAFTVLDRDVTAGFPLARANLIGQPVTLGVSFSDGSGITTFRGRVTDQSLTPVGDRGQIPGGFTSTGGFALQLSASSKEVDLANYPVRPDTSWTPETALARRSRIAAQLPAGFLAGGIQLPDVAGMGLPAGTPEFSANTVAQPTVGTGTDVHTLLRQLWDSCYPAPMVYDPNADAVVAVRPPTFAAHANGTTPTGRLIPGGASRLEDYVAVPEQVFRAGSSASQAGIHLDARSVTDADLGLAIDAHLSLVQVSYQSQTSAAGAPLAYQQATTTAGVYLDEDTRGRRTLTVDTILTSSSAAATLAGYWATLAAAAPARRRLGPVGYSTANPHNGGGFDTGLTAATLLAGCEQSTPLFIGGTWLPAIGARPMFVILGATTTYADGDWTVNFTPHPVTVASGADIPLTYATFSASPVQLGQLDDSVSYADLAWIDIGPGYTAATQPH